MPPAPVPVAAPMHTALHDRFVLVVLTVNAVGSVMVIGVFALHPFASIAVTLYVPAHKLLIVCVVWPDAHL